MNKLAEQVEHMGATVRYNTSVDSCRQPYRGSWTIVSAPLSNPLEMTTETFDKLVVATGTFSVPSVPSFVKPFIHPWKVPLHDLNGLITIHTSHLSEPTVQDALYARPRRLAIIGGSKSALDAAERLASVSAYSALHSANPREKFLIR